MIATPLYLARILLKKLMKTISLKFFLSIILASFLTLSMRTQYLALTEIRFGSDSGQNSSGNINFGFFSCNIQNFGFDWDFGSNMSQNLTIFSMN